MEAELEKPGTPRTNRPIASLPRQRWIIDKDGNRRRSLPVVEFFVEVAKGVAGCVVCDRPIQKGGHRLRLRVHLHRPTLQADGKVLKAENYYAHPGCITEKVRPEIVRTGIDCYMCGIEPDLGDKHPFRVFTVSKFAPAPLCGNCALKTSVHCCSVCSTHYPPNLVSRVTNSEERRLPLSWAEITREPASVEDGSIICHTCAKLYRYDTELSIEEARAQFESERERIMREGL